MLIKPPSRQYLRKDSLSLHHYYSNRFFQGAFPGNFLTDPMVLNERSESKSCTVSAGKNSRFANVEARTSILEVQSLLHTVDSASNHLENNAKVLGVAIWVGPLPRWITHRAPSINLKKPNPKSQQVIDEMPQSCSHASIEIVGIFSIHVVLMTAIRSPLHPRKDPSLTLLRLVLLEHLLHDLLLLNQERPRNSILYTI